MQINSKGGGLHGVSGDITDLSSAELTQRVVEVNYHPYIFFDGIARI